MAKPLTVEQIKTIVEKEVSRQLSSQPRIVRKDTPTKAVHRPILSNQPEK
jgi:hypothetical protein